MKFNSITSTQMHIARFGSCRAVRLGGIVLAESSKAVEPMSIEVGEAKQREYELDRAAYREKNQPRSP